MNFIILGIMALCGASLGKIATVAIILGVFDLISDINIDSFDDTLEKIKNEFENKNSNY